MTWARLDDRYDDTGKVKRAWRRSGYAVGLHTMAITACARHESDGLIDPEWLEDRLAVIPPAAGRKALDVLVEVGLFERLPAGEIRTVTDMRGGTVTLGPCAEDAYVVHDFLDYNYSANALTDRRRADAERKAQRRQPDSNGTPRGVRADTDGTPAGFQPESETPDPTRPDPTRKTPPPPADAGGDLPRAPSGNRRRDRERYREQLRSIGEALFPKADPDLALKAIEQAQMAGAVDEAAVRHFTDQWWPQLTDPEVAR